MVGINLIIDRADRTVNVCEIKYANNEFVITKKYEEMLKRRKEIFRAATRTKKHLFQPLIATYGVRKNDAYVACVDNQITLDQLF